MIWLLLILRGRLLDLITADPVQGTSVPAWWLSLVTGVLEVVARGLGVPARPSPREPRS